MDIKTSSDFQLWKYFEDQGHQIMVYREQNRTWITFSLEEKTQLVVKINLILVVPVHNENLKLRETKACSLPTYSLSIQSFKKDATKTFAVKELTVKLQIYAISCEKQTIRIYLVSSLENSFWFEPI